MDENLRFFVSAREGDLPKLVTLLDGGIDIDQENSGGATALEMASAAGQTEVVKLLLDRGARIDPVDSPCFSSALIASATNHHTSVVKMLLESGANPNIVDGEGQTALMWAAFHQSPLEVIRLLVLYGAALSIVDQKGNTALDYAEEVGSEEISAFIRQHSS
jgi:ankyrin repeat protein